MKCCLMWGSTQENLANNKGAEQSAHPQLVSNRHSQKDQKLFFKTNYRIMKVKSIAEGERSAILLTFIKLLLSLKSLFCLFLSGRFTQVILYPLRRSSKEVQAINSN